MKRGIVAAVMVTLTIGLVTAVALAQAPAADQATRTARNVTDRKPAVSPRSGGARTTFVINFISRVRLGRHTGFALEYELDTVEGNRHPVLGCEGSFTDLIRRGRPGQHLAFRESPAADAVAGWCPARYQGTFG
jgi:hypothetical protein